MVTDEVTEALSELATLGKASGDILRLQILRILSTESLGVLELSGVFDMRQPAMSHHLKVLAQAGLVSTRKEGNTVFYRRALPPAHSILENTVRALFQTIDQTPVSNKQVLRLGVIKEQRAEQSRVFFARNVKEFRDHQELIADHELYGKTVADLIATTMFPDNALAMELGPGEGAFLETLSHSFKAVYAVDNSDEMLSRSKEIVIKQKLDNVECIYGEIQNLMHLKGQFDCIVANMVLHHVPSPADIFAKAAQLLKPGGSLLISDLSRHNQNWVRESCGDLWLGFSAEEFSLWAEDAGLTSGESQYLGLRNGFQIQVRHFYLGA